MYKFMNNKLPEFLTNISEQNKNSHNYRTRTRNEIHRYHYNTSIMGNSYLIKAP